MDLPLLPDRRVLPDFSDTQDMPLVYDDRLDRAVRAPDLGARPRGESRSAVASATLRRWLRLGPRGSGSNRGPRRDVLPL